jgi:hypothetical protein
MAVDYGVCMGKLSRNGISGQDSKARKEKERTKWYKKEKCDEMLELVEEQAYGKRRDVDGEGDGGREIEELKRSGLEWERERDGDGRMGEGGKETSIAGRRCHKKVVGGPRIAEVDTLGTRGGRDRLPELGRGNRADEAQSRAGAALLVLERGGATKKKKTARLSQLLAALLIGSWRP